MFTWKNIEFPQRPGILTAELGINNKKESKKTRKHAFDQESEQEKKKQDPKI